MNKKTDKKLHCYKCNKTQIDGNKFFCHPTLMFCYLCNECNQNHKKEGKT